VKDKHVSGTARLIAASLVLEHEHAEFNGLVSAEKARFCRQFLLNYSERWGIFLHLARQRWFFRLASLLKRLTIPGILRHYTLRKRCIPGIVRHAVTDGVCQVAILGVGFDPLGLELLREFESVRIWEIDHPATQHYKMAETEVDSGRLHFVPINLQTGKIDAARFTDFNSAERTIWIAEGVLMYLHAAVVKEQFGSIATLSPPGSRFIFTFIEPRSDGRIRFDNQSRMVDWWLQQQGEPFAWGSSRQDLEEFSRPWRPERIFDDHDLRELASLPAHIPLATGELICLACLS
jgi:methyltransferase (TIGR00027 family)